MDVARPLRLLLRLNAAYSTSSGLVCLIAREWLAGLIGVPDALLVAVGLGLLAFAVSLVATAARVDLARLRAEALAASIADLGWVAGTLVVLAFGWLTPAGSWLLTGVGVPVLGLGLAQLSAARGLARTQA